MASIGLAVAAGAAGVLVGRWLQLPRVAAFGLVGKAGIGVFCGCAAVLALPLSEHAAVGALAWTGYVLAVDAAVFAARGRSLLRSRPDAFLWLAVLSVFLWLPFEWYNERLAGWYRSGLPPDLSRYVLLGWSFACVWPALLETADLLLALWFKRGRDDIAARRPGRSSSGGVAAAGAVLLLAPLALPRLDLGEHLLPLLSAGFLLLLEPWNAAGGRASLWSDARSREYSRLLALAGSGVLCGLWLDALNHFSHAKWHSLWSLTSTGALFELPWLAYAVLPLFGWQAFAMYEFAAGLLHLPRWQLGAPSDTAIRGQTGERARPPLPGL
ncbi:MAG: hypothetical protein OXH83_11275 [Bryobacterales bacterium]|nr:hypothetical protein [Bryobacterales bacterium]